jgi:hypothetical protein
VAVEGTLKRIVKVGTGLATAAAGRANVRPQLVHCGVE